mmetsp:Transcript_53544/g.92118  ORF Transcript_53544/g.92118 Transcript_53544/m.92118 type:complete len:251 (+) Transcript_53544:400-1152(+)
MKFVVHEHPKRVGVRRHVVAPDEVGGDVFLKLEEPLAKHEKTEGARRQRDADDVVRHERSHEAHESFGPEQREEEGGDVDHKAVQPRAEHNDEAAGSAEEEDAGEGDGELGEDVLGDPVGAVAALLHEEPSLHHEEGEHGHRHEDHEGGDVEQDADPRDHRAVAVVAPNVPEHEADEHGEHAVHREAHPEDAWVPQHLFRVALQEHRKPSQPTRTPGAVARALGGGVGALYFPARRPGVRRQGRERSHEL